MILKLVSKIETNKADIHYNPNSELKPHKNPRLTESELKGLKKNAVALIVNKDKTIPIRRLSLNYDESLVSSKRN